MEEQSDLKRCTKCGKSIPSQAVMCCFCDSVVGEAPSVRSKPEVRQHYYPGTAAVLSFFVPGLGQLYEQRLKAFLLLFIAYVVLVSLWFQPAALQLS